jgi:RHS repeat-associated protein
MTRSSFCASTTRFSPPRFTGKERDAESGNDYFGARYRASSMGRFTSPDTVIYGCCRWSRRHPGGVRAGFVNVRVALTVALGLERSVLAAEQMESNAKRTTQNRMSWRKNGGVMNRTASRKHISDLLGHTLFDGCSPRSTSALQVRLGSFLILAFVLLFCRFVRGQQQVIQEQVVRDPEAGSLLRNAWSLMGGDVWGSTGAVQLSGTLVRISC